MTSKEDRDKRDERIRDLAAGGWTVRQIAAELGCSRTTVRCALNPSERARNRARYHERLATPPPPPPEAIRTDRRQPTTGTILMAESEFTGYVRDLALPLGIRWQPSTPNGFPAVFVGPRGILWRTLKSQTAQVSLNQRTWGECVRRAGGNYAVWRPADLAHIRQQLKEIAP